MSTEGLFNLASGEKTSVNEICSIIKEQLNTKLSEKHIEAIAGEVRDIQLDISKAKKELNFKPTDISEGLRKTIDWFKHEYKK